MNIRFVLGRAGSGKSMRCLNEIRQHLLAEPQGNPLILLVPEQATFQAEHALVSTAGLNGMIRAQVMSFRRLAWRVMQETGETAKVPIDEVGKMMLLQRILHQHRDKIKLFGQSQGKAGFLQRLNDFFSELKRYCISAASLAEYTGIIGDKLADLLVVYHEYEQVLAHHYLDNEDYLTNLAHKLSRCKTICNADIWIDGFFGFTPQEQEVVLQSMRYCQSVTITLCLDQPYRIGELPDELNLFYTSAMTMVRLYEQLDKLGIRSIEVVQLGETGLPRFAGNAMLAHLEKNYEQRLSPRRKLFSVGNENELSAISLYAAVHRKAEVEGAAREILHLVREKKLRWKDIAVRVRDIESYADLLSAIFTDYHIPYFLDQKRTIMHHPLVEFIRSAMEVIQHNWSYDAVFRCVKTGFLDGNDNNRHAFDELENYVLAYGIHGYRWLEQSSWEIRRYVSLEGEPSVFNEQEEAALQRVRACSQLVVEPLHKLHMQMEQAGTVKERAQALFALLDDIGVPMRLQQWSNDRLHEGDPQKAREHKQVWDQIMNMLDQMVEMLQDDDISLELFARLLDTGLESIRMGLVPPALDQVLIGSIDRTRSTQVKYAFILGVNDGVMPKRMQEDSIISEKEREQLLTAGLQIAEGSRRKLLDEQLLIYSVLCAPSQHLWLSYPLADEEGKTLLPSEIMKQVQSLFPNLQQQFLLAEPDHKQSESLQMSYIAEPDTVLVYLISQLRQALQGERIEEMWWQIYNWFLGQPVWKDKLATLLKSLLYTNYEPALAEPTAFQLYGQHLQASVSRMERFAACPFAHFISHGLRLQERRLYTLAAPDIGQLFHAALSDLVNGMQQSQHEWNNLDDEELYAQASAVIDRLAPFLQSGIMLSSARYQYMAHKLKRMIGRTASALLEHARHGAFVPIGLELGFGPGQPIPSLNFRLNNGFALDLIGRIDRVDRADSSMGVLLRIIDYKSSNTSLNLAEVYYGLSLQMLTYLDVVITNAQQWIGHKAAPAGVLYLHVQNPLLQSKNELPAEMIQKKLADRYKTRGLVLADVETVALMDDQLSQNGGKSSLIPVTLKQDGSFHKLASVASAEQWHLLRGHVRQTIRQIGTDITDGVVEVMPYRLGNQIACTFCSFKSICHFDPLVQGNSYRVLQQQSKEQVFEAMTIDSI